MLDLGIMRPLFLHILRNRRLRPVPFAPESQAPPHPPCGCGRVRRQGKTENIEDQLAKLPGTSYHENRAALTKIAHVDALKENKEKLIRLGSVERIGLLE